MNRKELFDFSLPDLRSRRSRRKSSPSSFQEVNVSAQLSKTPDWMHCAESLLLGLCQVGEPRRFRVFDIISSWRCRRTVIQANENDIEWITY